MRKLNYALRRIIVTSRDSSLAVAAAAADACSNIFFVRRPSSFILSLLPPDAIKIADRR